MEPIPIPIRFKAELICISTDFKVELRNSHCRGEGGDGVCINIKLTCQVSTLTFGIIGWVGMQTEQ